MALELYRSTTSALAQWLASPGMLSAHLAASVFASQFGLLLLAATLLGMAFFRNRSTG